MNKKINPDLDATYHVWMDINDFLRNFVPYLLYLYKLYSFMFKNNTLIRFYHFH